MEAGQRTANIKRVEVFLKIFIQKTQLLLIFSVALMICGCSGDKNEDDYKVIGEMIAARNKARQKQSLSISKEQQVEISETDVPSETARDDKTIMMFEEEVDIISKSTGKVIAKATAYLDKSGKIINIRIRKNR